MRDRLQIIEGYEALLAAGQPAALATVVSVEGSSYRLPGARMLVAGDGRTWGTVSGGCLERDVARRARMLIPQPAQPVVVCYETDDEDGGQESARPIADPGPSLGCGGRIEILIQRVVPTDPGPIAALHAVVRRRTRASLATVIRVGSAGDSSVSPGAHLLRLGHDEPIGQLTDPALHEALLAHLRRDPPDDRSFEIHRCDLSIGGWADVLIEWMSPSQALAVFADGHDVAPLVDLAKALGWHVTIVGSRPVAGLRQSFPTADQLICSADGPADADVPLDAAAVVMAHNFHRDAAALAALLRHPRAYVGVLGPRRRTARLLAAAGLTGHEHRIHSPIGLDIGADNPEQIALAIVAEIQAVAAARPGGLLCLRPGPIHLNRNPTGISPSPGTPGEGTSVNRQPKQNLEPI
ncbi:MAG: XdhC family protein [Tepidisphaeraceae bacterium]|jgi:xanthine/CO dehydrogenase XdhC/CoxF family maturation factor